MASGSDTRFKKPRPWQLAPFAFALAALLSLFYSLTTSAITYLPPRPILPDAIAGIVFLLSIVLAVLAIRGFMARGGKR